MRCWLVNIVLREKCQNHMFPYLYHFIYLDRCISYILTTNRLFTIQSLLFQDMNRAEVQRVDPIIKSHGAIILESSVLTSKAMYSISCLQSAIEFQNSNRNANINYLQSIIEGLIVLGEKSKEISEDHLKSLLRLINTLLTEKKSLTPTLQASLMQIVLKVNATNGVMGEDLFYQIVSLCSKLKNQGQTSKLLLELMAQKMSPQQALRLIDSFRKNELYNSEVHQLIKLGMHYNKNQQVLSRVFQGLHWQICNVLPSRKDSLVSGKSIIDFIMFILSNNISKIKIVSLCSLIYRQIVDSTKIVDKASISKSLDSFLRQRGLKGSFRPYIVDNDKIVNNFSQLSVYLEADIDIQHNKQVQYLLQFYTSQQFKWREELLASMTNGKGVLAKQLLLRATENYSSQSSTTVKSISQKDEISFSSFLPIQCLRSLPSILNKLHKDPSPHNALQVIGYYHNFDKNHPLFNDILLLLLEIYLKNRQFTSLRQIQRIIKDEIKGDFVIKKLKEKGSIKNKDSNRQSKRYFICIPLVCSRSEVQSVSEELSQIFIHETVHISLKLYVADFTISKMILYPSKAFIVYLTRFIETNFSVDLERLILSYLEPHSINQNPAVSQWYSKHFTESTQKLTQFLFSKLIIPQVNETAKILFLLQKFNLYGQTWLNSYRWILNGLQDINEIYSDHTVDCLEIFQMIIQKITVGNVPTTVIQRFEKIVLKNWGRYNQEHLFAIERIVSLLNEHSYLGFKELPLPSFDQFKEELTHADLDKNQVITSYINNLTFNLFFGHIDSQNAFQSLLKWVDQFKRCQKCLSQKSIVAVLNLLLFLFEGSEQAVDAKADDLVILFLTTDSKNSTKVQGKCLEYLSRIPHNINILKLPLSSLTMQGFYNPIWLGDLTELINIVSESKPKAIGAYKLQQVLKSMMIYLIASENKELVNSFMDYLEATCFIQGDYQVVLEQSLSTLENVLIAERCGVGYRKSLVQFSLGALLDYQCSLRQDLLWFLMKKYATEPEIISIILEYFQKFPMENPVLHEKLLMRIVLIHTQNDKIQEKCKALFKLHAPKTSDEQLFIDNFSNSNYEKCEELIQKISNPYALNFTFSDIRSLLEWKDTSIKCKKILSFLHNHPEHQNKLYECQAFILSPDYISYISELLDKIDIDPIIEKFQSQKRAILVLKRHQGLEILEKTLTSILKNKQSVLKFKGVFMEAFKNRQDDFSVLLRLVVLIFSRQKKEKRTNDELKYYSKFFNQLCGELQLKDKQKASKFVVKNLIYIFPYFLSNNEIVSQFTPINCILRHYRSVVESFSTIQKEIGSNKYFLLLTNSISLASKNIENKNAFAQEYLKIHILLEGNDELTLKKEDKATYTSVLLELNDFINKITETKTRQNNNKLDSSFVNGFIAHLLFLINQGVSLDIDTFQIVKSIQANVDSLSCGEGQKQIIKEALQWIMKNIEKSLPLKVVEQKSAKKASLQDQKKQKQESPKITSQSKKTAESPKKAEYESSKPHSFELSSQNQSPEKHPLKKPQESEESQKYQKNQSGQKSSQPFVHSVKYREVQQITIVNETIQTTKKKTIVIQNPQKSQQLFSEQVEKPKQQTFNQDKFYKVQEPTVQKIGPSDNERKYNLENIKNRQAGELSIQSLKDHCKFISSLSLLTKINQQEFTQLLISIQSINQTVSSHSFYVRKVSQFEISTKLVKIYKTMWREGSKKNCQNIVLDILQLCLTMSKMKEKKLVLFNEEQIVQFFKMVVKRVLNSQSQEKQIPFLLDIIYNCRNNTEVYFTLGLLSMLIEVINRDKDPATQYILEYFIKIDLTPQIINEIYQRGLFNKLVQCFNTNPSTQSAKKALTLWIKLAGKVCINPSIQQKFCSKQLHSLVWSKISLLTKPSERKDVAYFLAYLCLKNETVSEWMIQTKVLEELLSSLSQVADNEELYLLFYHFCFGSTTNRDYCIRIKYHLHLMGRLSQRWLEIQQNREVLQLSKYFYKSLGQMMSSRHNSSTYFKDQCVKKLIDIFESKCQPAIVQCLLDFVSVLQTEAEFDELKRQKFWQTLKVFEYKISSEATYTYLLQIFLIMIKKGRTKEVSQADFRHKVCLKAEFSINMEGKQLALRFLLAMSIKDKENYFNQKSINILANILGLKVSKHELQLTSDILRVEGASKNQQFLRLFIKAKINDLIIESLDKLTAQELKLAYSILLVLCQHAEFSKSIASTFLPFVKRLLQKENGQTIVLLLQLLNNFSEYHQNKQLFSFQEIQGNIKSESISSKVKEKNCEKEFQMLLSNIVKLKGLAAAQANNHQNLRKAVKTLRQGKKVKMYKIDGSISELFIFISSDCLEINCGLTLSEVVKQKWRLPLNEISKIVNYTSQDSGQFKNSYFEKNSGFFTKTPPYDTCLSLIGKNNEFHICFSPGDKDVWKANLELAIEYARNLLSNLGKK